MSNLLGAFAAQTLSSTTTVAQEGGRYGVLGLSGVTIGVLFVIMAGMAAVIAIIGVMAKRHRRMNLPAGIISLGLIACVGEAVLAAMLLISWWTAVNWSSDNESIAVLFASMILLIALWFGLWASIDTLLKKY